MKSINTFPNARGTNLMWSNLVYIMLIVIAAVITAGFVYNQLNNAAFTEEYFAKEIALAINRAEPGDTIHFESTGKKLPKSQTSTANV